MWLRFVDTHTVDGAVVSFARLIEHECSVRAGPTLAVFYEVHLCTWCLLITSMSLVLIERKVTHSCVAYSDTVNRIASRTICSSGVDTRPSLLCSVEVGVLLVQSLSGRLTAVIDVKKRALSL